MTAATVLTPTSAATPRKLSATKPAIFKKMLLATGESDACKHAAGLAAAFARRYGSELTVVHALPAYPVDRKRDKAELERALLMLEGWTTRMGLSAITKERIVFREEPSIAIARLLKREPLDLLLLGTHASGGFERLLLGSVAEEVTRQSTVPGLIIGPKCGCDYDRMARLRTVLFATDLSKPSFAAISLLSKLQASNDTRVIALHAVESMPKAAPQRHHLVSEVSQKVAEKAFSIHLSDIIVEQGRPARLVDEFVRALGVDAVVLGIRGGSEFTRAATHLRSLTSKIIAAAGCPVFTVATRSAQ